MWADPPLQISPSVLPLKAAISPAIPARRNELPTSGGRWKGEKIDRATEVSHHDCLVVLPLPSRTTRESELSHCNSHHEIPFQRLALLRFAFLSAFSVPRSRCPRPSEPRCPSSNPLRASSRCGLLPPGSTAPHMLPVPYRHINDGVAGNMSRARRWLDRLWPRGTPGGISVRRTVACRRRGTAWRQGKRIV